MGKSVLDIVVLLAMKGIFENKPKRYLDFKSYLRERFGATVFKLPIDAGFTCPNRDGKVGLGGCIYCDGRGSKLRRAGPLPSVVAQIKSGMAYYREHRHASLFMAYFQTFSNTYAAKDRLKNLYDQVLSFPEVVALAVGTRPDCLPDDVIALLASYGPDRQVWVELGIQSMHSRTLALINRCHLVEDFISAARRADAAGLLVCAHVILGLPGESDADMRATAEALARLPIAGVKIHLLLVLEGTALAAMYRRGHVAVQSLAEYASRAADFLESLPPHVVIQRLTADGYGDILLAPDWARNKMAVINAIHNELERRGTRQGSLFVSTIPGRAVLTE